MAVFDLSEALGAVSRPDLTDAELARISAGLENAPPSRVITWAVAEFGTRLALTASMTDAVLIDLATRVDPGIEVVFIDTGYHFPETLETVETVRRRYGLNLRIMTVALQDEALWEADPGELLLRGQGRPARPGPRRQRRVDERPAPRRGADPRQRADRRA